MPDGSIAIADSVFEEFVSNNAFIPERVSPLGIDLPEDEDNADFSF